jgi:hypothetical protein
MISEQSYTPVLMVAVVCILIAIFGAASWKHAKGEGWGQVLFLAALILGFNLSVTFAAWMLEAFASLFGGLASWLYSAEQIGGGIGIVAVMVTMIGASVLFSKVKFDSVKLAAQGTLIGIILRLLSDFMFWLMQSNALGAWT